MASTFIADGTTEFVKYPPICVWFVNVAQVVTVVTVVSVQPTVTVPVGVTLISFNTHLVSARNPSLLT